MPEVFRDVPGYVNDLADDLIRLAKAGKVDEVRAVVARLLSQASTDEEHHEVVPGQAALTFRGIVGEVRVAATRDDAPVQLTVTCPEYAHAPEDFAKLVDMMNQAIRSNKNFIDAHGKPTPAQEMEIEDLIHEVGRIIEERMDGWIRVERTPTVRLD
jgi:ribosomal protein L17